MKPVLTTEDTEGFMGLFEGNAHCYGSGGEQGRCVWQQPTFHTFDNHLLGEEPIGIYPVLVEKLQCKWGCIDIDVDDFGIAQKLVQELDKAGISGIVELSRSKGYHVWVFSSGWVPANVMRTALLAARQLAGLEDDVDEVNPKQTDFPMLPNGLPSPGNYVRLPYPKIGMSGRQVFLRSNDNKVPFREALKMAEKARVEPIRLQRLAVFYEPPVFRRSTFEFDAIDEDVEVPECATRYVRRMIQGGPLDDNGVLDRSGYLVRLVGKCREDDLTAGEAMQCLVAADNRVGKYRDRNDREQRLREIIERVY